MKIRLTSFCLTFWVRIGWQRVGTSKGAAFPLEWLPRCRFDTFCQVLGPTEKCIKRCFFWQNGRCFSRWKWYENDTKRQNVETRYRNYRNMIKSCTLSHEIILPMCRLLQSYSNSQMSQNGHAFRLVKIQDGNGQSAPSPRANEFLAWQKVDILTCCSFAGSWSFKLPMESVVLQLLCLWCLCPYFRCWKRVPRELCAFLLLWLRKSTVWNSENVWVTWKLEDQTVVFWQLQFYAKLIQILAVYFNSLEVHEAAKSTSERILLPHLQSSGTWGAT